MIPSNGTIHQHLLGHDLGHDSESYHHVTNPAESVFYGIFLVVANILGTFGNSLVVHASLRYGAFGLDRVTVTLIRHLAFADIFFQ